MGTSPVPEEGVFGLDNVRLDLQSSGAATRALAAALDYMVLSALTVLLVGGSLAAAAALQLDPVWMVVLAITVFVVLEYGYFAGTELAMGGQTIGKKAMGLRVVTRDGAQAGATALLVRNAVRTVDLFVGIPLMMMDPLARRLGDRLAGTLVVHEEPARRHEVVIRRVPRGWSGAEVAVVEDFLRRARSLEPDRAQAMAAQILAAISRADPELASGGEPGADRVEALRRMLGANA